MMINNKRIPAPRSWAPRRIFGAFLLALAVLLPFLLGFPAPNVRFAVVSDTHVGAGSAADDLRAIVASINADTTIGFVVLTGDISEKGKDEEFREAKSILDGLAVPYYVIPGNHDTHWVGFGGTGFVRTFGADRFFFARDGQAWIGLNAWDAGHFAPPDLAWLEETVHGLAPETVVFFFTHNPPETVDNWIAAHNILRLRRTCVIAGHVHADGRTEKFFLPVLTVRAAIRKVEVPPGYAVVESGTESIAVSLVLPGEPPRLWETIAKPGWKQAPAIALSPLPPAKAAVLWRQELKTRLHAAPVFDGKRLFAADHSGRITCFDLKGKVLWSFEAKAPFVSRPAVHDKFLLAASSDGRIIKLDAASGRHFASTDLHQEITSQLVVFIDERGKIPRLLVGASSGRLTCLNVFNLTPFWTSDAAKGLIQTRPLAAGGRIVFGAWDGAAHTLETATGKELWRWTENDNFYYSPAACVPATDGRSVFFCSPDGFVSAVDPETGKTFWRAPFTGWESLGITSDGGRLLVKSRVDEFHVIDALTGKSVQKISPAQGGGDFMPVEPVEAKGKILFGAQNGRVYGIDRGGRVEILLDLGPGGIHTLIPLGGDRFAAATVDGTIVVFRVSA
jgi:outer membrane protein assembly factor BamB